MKYVIFNTKLIKKKNYFTPINTEYREKIMKINVWYI